MNGSLPARTGRRGFLRLSQAIGALDRQVVVAVGALLTMVLLLWLPFGFHTTGLIEEWDFYGWITEGHSIWFIGEDSVLKVGVLRPLFALPTALSHFLLPDSFVALNVLQLLFIAGKGIFLFLILRLVMPKQPEFAFICAALYMLYPVSYWQFSLRIAHYHASLAGMALAIYLYLLYSRNKNPLLLLAMWLACGASLLMYESTFVVAAVAPVILLMMNRRFSWYFVSLGFVWYLAPLLVGIRYIWIWRSSQATYQQALAAAPVSAERAIGALQAALSWIFWGGWVYAAENTSASASLIVVSLAMSILAVTVAASVARGGQVTHDVLSLRVHAMIIAAGFALIVLGYAPYLPSPGHYPLLGYTLLLSSVGGALCLTSLLYAVSVNLIGSRKLFVGLFGVLVMSLGLIAGSQHQDIVRRSAGQQRLFAAMAEQAPSIVDTATIAIIDESGRFDDVWFFLLSPRLTWALQYFYDNPHLSAVICLPDNKFRSIGDVDQRCRFDDSGLVVDNFNPFSRSSSTDVTNYENLIVFRQAADGQLILIRELSDVRAPDQIVVKYAPEHLIDRVQPTRRAFTLFSCWPISDCVRPNFTRPLPPGRLSLRLWAPAQAAWLDFDAVVPGTGWRGPEVTPTGVSFQWSVEREATVLLDPLAGDQFDLEFNVVGIIRPNLPTNLRLMINGQVVPYRMARASNGGTLYQATFGRAVSGTGPQQVRITIGVDELVVPEAGGQGLGVAIDYLRVSAP